MLVILAGLVAAFGMASASGQPFMQATLGLGTAWLGGFALLAAPLGLFLLAAVTVCLAGEAVLLWRQRSVVACAPGAICTRPVTHGVTVIGLPIWFVLLYLSHPYA